MSCDTLYDYIIVGAGPTGLTLAWLLAQEPTIKKILIVERADSIGGCHRVERDLTTNLFTEHGPRIYSTTYVNVIEILNSMNISFYDLFTEYKFSHGSMSQEVLSKLTPWEVFKLAIEYVKLVFDPAYALFTTVADFLEINEFSKVSKDVIGKICHLTDGAGPERFTMNQLLHGFDHHVFYKFMQPKLPNDKGLFPLWQDRLLRTGKVDIWLNSDVKSLLTDDCGGITGLDLIISQDENQNGNQNTSYDASYDGKLLQVNAKNVILAIPPEHALRISGLNKWTTVGRVFSSNPALNKSPGCISLAPDNMNNTSNDNLPIRQIVDTNKISTINIAEFGNLAKYDYYIPIVFHYPYSKECLNLPLVWGFPTTDWGVITIVLSDYMDFNDPRSKTVITSCISLTDRPSSFTGLTANQTSDRTALMKEVYRQANIVYKNTLPEPFFGLSDVMKVLPASYLGSSNKSNIRVETEKAQINCQLLQKGIMLISPGVSYSEKQHIWKNSDSSFINTPKAGHLPNWENAAIPGLFWVGSLNGQSYYNFSSMESAVSNAIAFYLSRYDNPKYKVRSIVNFSTVLRVILFIILLIVVFKYIL